ncbi:MAG: sigma-70 family RNA polymerase sigma factor [Planctomycetota bacterium]
MESDSKTRASLLMQLRDAEDQVAWQQFVDRYGPMIYQWCRFWKLQEADAEDITQTLLVKLFHQLSEFEYDPSVGSFRGWLKTVTHNAVRDFSRRRRPTHVDEATWHAIGDQLAQEDFAARVEQAYDLEQLELAKESVRERVADHTWRAYELCEQGMLATDAIARETGLQIAMVYVAKSKVIRMLREELAVLE